MIGIDGPLGADSLMGHGCLSVTRVHPPPHPGSGSASRRTGRLFDQHLQLVAQAALKLGGHEDSSQPRERGISALCKTAALTPAARQVA